MIVYVNRKPVSGPWGGGSKILTSIISMLKDLGAEVIFEWSNERHFDVIYCHDPRPDNTGIWYQHFLNRKLRDGIPIIQRVGDVGTHGKPALTRLVKQTMQYSDKVIFPSIWAKEYVECQRDNTFVIPNAPLDIFYQNRGVSKDISSPLRVVTHHWSNNPLKGFDLYRKLASYCSKVTSKIEFSFVGRFDANPPGVGINILEPMDKESLSGFLPRHDIYLTASLEEAGANHVLEAMASGVPVLYSAGGGSITEYCCQHGLEYSGYDDLVQKIYVMSNNYATYKDATLGFNRTISDVMHSYREIFLL